MSDLLKLILSFLILGVGEETVEGADGEDTAAGGDGADPGEGDDTQEGGEGEDTLAAAGGDDALFDYEEEPAPKKKPEEELAEERERRIRAEAAAEELRRGAPHPSGVADNEEARIRAQEDRELNDPKADPWRKWQIGVNRAERVRDQRAQQAVAVALDTADRANFNLLATTKPQIHKRYAERVEQELQKARAQGFNPTREVLLKNLIGQDALEGKFVPRKAAAPSPRGRTQTPGARSDVATKGRLTEAQKREARLANQLI